MSVNRSAFINAPRRNQIDADALLLSWDPTDPLGEVFTAPVSALPSGGGGQTVYDVADYVSIQGAIDAAYADGGGIVQLGAGDFVTTGLELYPRCWLRGSGVEVTRLLHGSSNVDAIHVDDARWVQVSDMSIVGTGDSGGGTSSGITTTVTGNTARNASDYVVLRNLFIDEFPVDGVAIDTPIVSHVDSVTVQHVGRHGFNIFCDQVDINGTSTTLTNCYAAGCVNAGFRFHRMSYCSVNGAASDANGVSYWIYGCKGITLLNPGSETPYYQTATYDGRTVYVYGSWGIVFVAPWFINNIGVCIDVQGESHVTLLNAFEGSPGNADSSNNNPTHWLRVGVDCEVTVIDEQVATTGEDIDAGAIVRRSSAWGLKDRPGAWTANQEYQATLYVSGDGTLLVEGTTDFASGLTVSAGNIDAQGAAFAENVELAAGKTLYVPGTITVEGTLNCPTPNADGKAANKGYVDAVATSAQTGANYTLAITDAGKVVEMATSHKVRVPTDASVNFPVGTCIEVMATGATPSVIVDAVDSGTTTIVSTAGADPTLTTQWSSLLLRKRAANSWVATGAIS